MRDFTSFVEQGGNPRKPLLHYLRLHYAHALHGPNLPAFMMQPAPAPHVHYQLPLHLTTCNPPLACGPTVSDWVEPIGEISTCSSHQDEVARPSKRRKIYRKNGSKLVGAERLSKRKKNEDLRQKLRRKFGSSYNVKPWRRAVEQSLHPESSSDEEQGWSVPGEYLRSLFDLPEGYVADDSQREDLPAGVHRREDGSFLWNDEYDV